LFAAVNALLYRKVAHFSQICPMAFQVSDLVGLSAPLTRLIEVVSAGVGKVSAPYLVAWTARAKGKEIQHIAKAIQSATNNAPLDISYDNGKIGIKSLDSQKFITEATTIEDRASERILFEAAKQQLNLEKISSHAAIELLPEQSVPNAKPDEDWTARFFDCAKIISSEQMQELWGRILAGEIKHPGSYSLKTLDAARSLTKKDAEWFERITSVAFATGPEDVFVLVLDDKWLAERGIPDREILNLADLGLLHQAQVGLILFANNEEMHVLHQGKDAVLIVKQEAVIHPTTLRVWKFTHTGAQLTKLVHDENDDALLDNAGGFLKNLQYKVCVSRFLVDGATVRFEKLRDL
jgi:uncharacterized repeat protein (TIGR03899 family)